MFSCEFTIYEKDYTQFNMYYIKKIMWKYMVIYFFFLVYILHKYNHDYLINAAIALFITVAIWYLCLLFLLLHSKRVYKSNKLLQNKTTVSVDVNGIRELSTVSETNIQFSNVYQVRESKYAVYIFTAKNAAIIIPKRILKNDDIDVLYNLLRSNIDPKKNKL